MLGNTTDVGRVWRLEGFVCALARHCLKNIAIRIGLPTPGPVIPRVTPYFFLIYYS